MLEPLRRRSRKLDYCDPTANPQMVMILPGFATPPVRMRYLARLLESAGHRTKRWGLGFNWGPRTRNVSRALEARLADLHARHGRPVVLPLGWSLGGLCSRVSWPSVSPMRVGQGHHHGRAFFSGSPRANNVWRGRTSSLPATASDLTPADRRRSGGQTAGRDGSRYGAPMTAQLRRVVPPDRPGERDRAIALRCTHLGFTYDPQVIMTVLGGTSLKRPVEAARAPHFAPGLSKRFPFPDASVDCCIAPKGTCGGQ